MVLFFLIILGVGLHNLQPYYFSSLPDVDVAGCHSVLNDLFSLGLKRRQSGYYCNKRDIGPTHPFPHLGYTGITMCVCSFVCLSIPLHHNFVLGLTLGTRLLMARWCVMTPIHNHLVKIIGEKKLKIFVKGIN